MIALEIYTCDVCGRLLVDVDPCSAHSSPVAFPRARREQPAPAAVADVGATSAPQEEIEEHGSSKRI